MLTLQPAFAKISEMGIRYSALPGHTAELAQALNDVLSAKWRDLRGLEIVSFGVSSVNASKEDEQIIKDLQKSAVMRDPTMAAATLVGAQADAMRSAAANEGSGGNGVYGNEYGGKRRRHECTKSFYDGTTATVGDTGRQSGSGAGRVEMCLRSRRK